MSAEDMRMNTLVRSVLSAFSVDQNQLYVSCRGGSVALRGKLHLRRDAEGAVSGGTIQAMQEQIMNQKGVKKVVWQLDNWKMQGTRWVAHEE